MVRLMDCTLRDGANVVGKGFDAEITKIVLDILTESNVPIIEFGNAGGIGAYEVAGFTNALTDMEYLDLVQPYLGSVLLRNESISSHSGRTGGGSEVLGVHRT